MIRKLYKINNTPHFTGENDYLHDSSNNIMTPVDIRIFTEDELSYGVFDITGNFVVDTARRDSDISNKKILRIKNLESELMIRIDSEIEQIALSKYPKNIRFSFSVKEIEANNYILNGSSNPSIDIPSIYEEAKTTHATQAPTSQQLTDISNRILANSIAFKRLSGHAQAISSKYLAIINDPATDILNYSLPGTLL